MTYGAFSKLFANHWVEWSTKRQAGTLTDQDNQVHAEFIAEARRRRNDVDDQGTIESARKRALFVAKGVAAIEDKKTAGIKHKLAVWTNHSRVSATVSIGKKKRLLNVEWVANKQLGKTKHVEDTGAHIRGAYDKVLDREGKAKADLAFPQLVQGSVPAR